MSSRSNGGGFLKSAFEAERRLHAMAPIKDGYSKLLFRTILWFLFFALVYTVVTSLL